jgi:predicted transcriptional regulator of viral defense system
MRRLIAKAAFRAVLPEAMAFLSPYQTGVGVKGGCEAIVHAVQRTVDQCVDDPEYAAGLADAVNAFNLVKRQKFLDCVLEN